MIYVNPIIDEDYSDPDAIRVGNDYWMVASSFNSVPGLPILHSDDLVSWEHVANALPTLWPWDHYQIPRPDAGVWAPAIRWHDEYHLTFPDPDHGIFDLTAPDPTGDWSPPRLILPGSGLIDPCPLWDDDGRAYIVHGWAASRAGYCNRITLVEMDEQLQRPIGEPMDIVVGEDIGCTTLEGPKIYKRDGWYWIFAPVGGVAHGSQMVLRARQITGPYDHRIVLQQGKTKVNGPHQGAWVTTAGGQHWFLHFQQLDPYGRLVHLQPMTWDDQGWPSIGTPGADGIGEPVHTHPVPHTENGDGDAAREERELVHSPEATSTQGESKDCSQSVPNPRKRLTNEVRNMETVDERSEENGSCLTLSDGVSPQSSSHLVDPRWSWQANPADDWVVALDSPDPRLGPPDPRGASESTPRVGTALALAAISDDWGDLRTMGHVLSRRVPARPVWITAEVDGAGLVEGRAGLVLLGQEYLWCGVVRGPSGFQSVIARSGVPGQPETVLWERAGVSHLRLSVAVAGGCATVWADTSLPILDAVELSGSRWLGVRAGYFASAPVGGDGSGYATFAPLMIERRPMSATPYDGMASHGDTPSDEVRHENRPPVSLSHPTDDRPQVTHDMA